MCAAATKDEFAWQDSGAQSDQDRAWPLAGHAQ